MKNEYTLQDLFYLDQMHDQTIDEIAINEEKLVFYYKKVRYYEENYTDGANNEYYREHKDYSSCKITFIREEDGFNGEYDGYAEVRVEKKLKVRGKVYSMNEFIEFLGRKKYVIETRDYFLGCNTICIYAKLANEKEYREDCVITLSVSKIIYEWS